MASDGYFPDDYFPSDYFPDDYFSRLRAASTGISPAFGDGLAAGEGYMYTGEPGGDPYI
jgi:hypothetical protein